MGGLTVRLSSTRETTTDMTTTESEPRTFSPDLLAAAKNCGDDKRWSQFLASTLSHPI
jgi:hypothetical protein